MIQDKLCNISTLLITNLSIIIIVINKEIFNLMSYFIHFFKKTFLIIKTLICMDCFIFHYFLHKSQNCFINLSDREKIVLLDAKEIIPINLIMLLYISVSLIVFIAMCNY